MQKKDVRPVDCQAVLDKLAAMPISQWHYQWEESDTTPHLGPMAQDFKAAFYPGRDDTGISTLEADGVALAAIQGLNQKFEENEAAFQRELNQKDAKIAKLEDELAELKELVGRLAGQVNGAAQ